MIFDLQLFATVGQALLTPDAGYQRIDDSDANITYSSAWVWGGDSGMFGGGYHYSSDVGSYAEFNFTGSNLRLIGMSDSNRTTSVSVYIDGVLAKNFSAYAASTVKDCLDCDISGLANEEHYVKIINNSVGSFGTYYVIDAIDIDSAGVLKPYSVIAHVGTPFNVHADSIRTVKASVSVNSDTDRVVTNVSLIPFSVLTDTVRKTYSPVIINVDTNRVVQNHTGIAFIVNSDTKRITYSHENILSDTCRKLKADLFGMVKVENINIGMQISSPFDTVNATVLSNVNYASTMNLFGTYQGLSIDFITERIKDSRTPQGRKWTLSGRSDISNLLLTPVVRLVGGGTASEICSAMGLTTDFTDFTPAYSKLGWRNSTTKAISITEKSVATVLGKLFSWTKGLGTREINWYQRGTNIHVCERGKIVNAYAVEDYMWEGLEIDSQILLKTTESLCTDGTTLVSTPGSYAWTPEYATVPLTETQTFGNSTVVIVDGLTMSETNGANSTVNTWNQIYADPYSSSFAKPLYSVIATKVTTNATSRSTTNYTYGTPVNTSKEVTLSEETTVVESYTAANGWVVDNTHRTVHTPLSNGYYGHTVYDMGTDGNTIVATSLSKGAGGGQASLATIQQVSGYNGSGGVSGDTDIAITEKFNGIVLNSTNIPVQDLSIINQYIRIVNTMNKAKEVKLNVTLIGGTLIDARQSTITFEGNLYYIESNSISGTARVLKQQSITAVRWA